MPENTKVPILAALQQECGSTICFIMESDFEAKKLAAELEAVAGNVVYLPGREVELRRSIAHSLEAASLRISAIGSILFNQPGFITASQQALRAYMPPPASYLSSIITIEEGAVLDYDEIVPALVRMGYERVAMVEGRGQFSIRGGILDLFPVQSQTAYRMELFSDEVEFIREVDILTQRSGSTIGKIIVLPATEAPLDEAGAGEAAKKLFDLAKTAGSKAGNYLEECAYRLLEGGTFEGAEGMIPLLYNNYTSFLSYLPKDTILCLDEPLKLKESGDLEDELFARHCAEMLEKEEISSAQCRQYESTDSLFTGTSAFQTLLFSVLARPYAMFHPAPGIQFSARVPAQYYGKIEALAQELSFYKQKQWRTVLAAYDEKRAMQLHQLLLDNGIEAVVIDENGRLPIAGEIVIALGRWQQGAEYTDIKLLFLTEREIFGTLRHRAVKKATQGRTFDTFAELKKGDHIVHEHHGIGIYNGLHTMKIDGKPKDFLMLQYAGGDKLYIPTEQIGRIQKYIGADDSSPKVSRLGGGEWEKTKRRVAESIRDMAQDLIALYAVREQKQGHAYSADTTWQNQFEENFPYEETADQLQSISEIKKDMESGRIMDRLLCGDVGYGKTEVAQRAAFKAVADSKQVAVLVPTTLLAQQHYNTFTERFAGFPVNIEMLSRFRSPTEQKKILKLLREGNVDIIIGTHALLGKGIKFKDLGLLIIDEEQRFGVEHKEKIKAIKQTVDVLTLTATPIPRTMEMSLIGIRDMSVIETPPEDRYPVQTYVMEYSDALAREAILKEMARGGQVYFVYNRVASMDRFHEYIRSLVPEASIGMAHGQMGETQLENIMLDFYSGKHDVLLCSTIIESGLDIANANTLIIYDADRLGLAQLYQIRGRVGRSGRVAYAYLTFRKDKVLTETAEKRLVAIREFTEFGAGFKIAMRDLQIRGAGNLLGAQQHGHMQSVGYEMYCRLMRDAVKTLKGEKVEPENDVAVTFSIDAHIPKAYIENEEQRIEIYKKIAAIQDEGERKETGEELIDRFGEPPKPVQNLMDVALLRAIAAKSGIAAIGPHGGEAVLQYAEDAKPDVTILLDVLQKSPFDARLAASTPPSIRLKLKNMGIEETMENLYRFVKELSVCMR